MDKLTPEAVAKHAEAWPVPLLRSHAGLWRFNESTGAAVPMLLLARMGCEDVEVREPRKGSDWQAYQSHRWPGTWTPVRPDGSDLPTVDESGLSAERIAIRDLAEKYASSEPPGRQGEAFRRFLVALASPGMGGPAGEPDPVPPNCIHLDHATAIAQARHAYHGRIGDQRAFAEGLLGPVVRALVEAEHALQLHADEMACHLDEAREQGRSEGRAEQRAAIVTGVEQLKTMAEKSIKRAEKRGDESESEGFHAEREGYTNVLVALKAGEWSAGQTSTRAAHDWRAAVLAELARPRPLDEWHEDYGAVLWWRLPVEEPPWCGRPDDSDWPGYHTHWTPLGPTPGAQPVQTERRGGRTRAAHMHAIVEAWERGALAQREAIVAGVKQELDELRAEKSYFGPREQAWTSVYARLKNGEWSAQP